MFKKLCKAIDKILNREPKQNLEEYENLADAINNDYYDYETKNYKDKDDYEIEI